MGSALPPYSHSSCVQADEAEEEQEEGELVEVVPEPTDEELLTQLGLQLEQQMANLTASDELPAGIMQQWAEEELQRDVKQWHPKRQLADQDSDDEEDGEGDAAEAVSFQDIKGSTLGPCKFPSSFLSHPLASFHSLFPPFPIPLPSLRVRPTPYPSSSPFQAPSPCLPALSSLSENMAAFETKLVTSCSH